MKNKICFNESATLRMSHSANRSETLQFFANLMILVSGWNLVGNQVAYGSTGRQTSSLSGQLLPICRKAPARDVCVAHVDREISIPTIALGKMMPTNSEHRSTMP